MNLGKGTLEDWLNTPRLYRPTLKRGGDEFKYYSKYESFSSYLESSLHNEVTKAAILEEVKNVSDVNKMTWLNDHGPKHIQTVIQRASEMLTSKCDLNVREVFLLLNAIQVHDIGNFYGRAGHEKNIIKTLRDGLTPIVFDATEINYINNIAQVHGGKIIYKNGTESKNTIGQLKEIVTTNGYDIKLQLLASILRFADELADDKHRSDILALQKGLLPKGSEIYHAYAFCLDSVRIRPEQKKVELHFKISKDFLERQFGKYLIKEDKIIDRFIIDEIFDRTLKMHYERIYCSKFWKTNIEIDEIWVHIEFYNNVKDDDYDAEQSLNGIHPDITYTLKDFEYPSNGNVTIYTLCPNLKYDSNQLIEGKTLLAKIQK
ncbi:hypothetical protein QFZ37_000555 [Chryseobacterium ginsenosidimutans]|uniref:HD domain-containing protein n=1 Tax=Chryseobacterium ginsenosidimutans TaxID=687846 RepID=UPI00278B296C|nr:hypothetical protein [Chryseobacterium ginsenosidimutans]MDQ0592186.1 hypothetical protein [Chryseobacterium ginsenosidimutans]